MPTIYSFLKQLKEGKAKPEPITDNELYEMKNLKKKVEYYKDLLGEQDEEEAGTESEEDQESDDEVEDVQPKKKNIKQ